MRDDSGTGGPTGTAALAPGHPVLSRDLLVLWLVSLALYLCGLWIEPLRDWEEGTYARIAHEMAAQGWAGFLHPTLWGQPFLNKPPLLFGLMALAFRLLGETAFAARLPGAVLTATMIPLLALLVSDLTGRRDRALWAGAVLLTLLPVLRHGRLAMLDGAATGFFVLTLLGLVRSRRNAVWPWVAGLGLAGMLMTKGLLALPLLAIALAFLEVQRRRAALPPLRGRLWAGLALGAHPALAWFALQWATYGGAYLQNGLVRQGLDRVAGSIEGHGGTPLYYLADIAIYAWPWLLFLPAGLALAWRQRAEPWAALALIWLLGYVALITLMPTKLPWYVYPAYPALAMILGSACADAASGLRGPEHWLMTAGQWGLLPVGLASLAAAGVFSPWGPDPVPQLVIATLLISMACCASLWLWRRPAIGLPVLAAGVAAALFFFTISGRTVWELNEETKVQPLAALIREHVPGGATVYITLNHNRSSLSYYAGRPISPHQGREAGAYWLTRPEQLGPLGNPPVLGSALGWVLAGPGGG